MEGNALENLEIGLELRMIRFVNVAFEVDAVVEASPVFVKAVCNLATSSVPQFMQHSKLTAVAAKRRQAGGTDANVSGKRFAMLSPES